MFAKVSTKYCNHTVTGEIICQKNIEKFTTRISCLEDCAFHYNNYILNLLLCQEVF